MKKTILIIIAVILIIGLGVGMYYAFQDRGNKQGDNMNNNKNNDNVIEGNKILVVYFSAQNHTKKVAEKIADNLGADIFEIVPKDEYTADDLDWTDSKSRVSREHDNESLRNVELKTTKVDDWDSYDTVLIGYPIWWGIAAWPVDTFVKTNSFDGKTVIPFCTSSSSCLGQSGERLEEEAGTGNWKSGYRFFSSASDDEIKTFTDSLVK
jgi:hypothetical protein